MTKGAFRIPIYGGNPDPATYCPNEGYYDPDDPDSGVIWNPINPNDGWNLILEFQTNSPGTTTFDPSITASSGEYAWDLGDGNIAVGTKNIEHTYSDGTTKTVKLYSKGTCIITEFLFSGDNIVGVLDVSNDAFKYVNNWNISSNGSMTSVTFPSTYDNNTSVGIITIASCNLTGNIDLSVFSKFTSAAFIALAFNPLLTSVTFASSITGGFTNIQLHSTGLTSIDLSKFTSCTVGAALRFDSCSSLTSVTMPVLSSGIIGNLFGYSCTSLGYFNLTGLSTARASISWQFQNNGWSAAIVNQVLVDIDGISTSGFTGRVVNVGGTNADPDTTSGGYDGTAARNQLITDGFTVTIT